MLESQAVTEATIAASPSLAYEDGIIVLKVWHERNELFRPHFTIDADGGRLALKCLWATDQHALIPIRRSALGHRLTIWNFQACNRNSLRTALVYIFSHSFLCRGWVELSL